MCDGGGAGTRQGLLCLRAAQAWPMALSPKSGQLSARFQVKKASSLGSQVSDPGRNTKPTAQIGTLRPAEAGRG